MQLEPQFPMDDCKQISESAMLVNGENLEIMCYIHLTTVNIFKTGNLYDYPQVNVQNILNGVQCTYHSLNISEGNNTTNDNVKY
jgi:hypothetical protein